MPPRKTLVLDLDGTLYPPTLGTANKTAPGCGPASSRFLRAEIRGLL